MTSAPKSTSLLAGFAMVALLATACAASESAAEDQNLVATQSPSTKTSEFCNSMENGIDEAAIMDRALKAGANPETTHWTTKPDGSKTLLVAIPDNSISGSDGCLIVTESEHLRSATYFTRERRF